MRYVTYLSFLIFFAAFFLAANSFGGYEPMEKDTAIMQSIENKIDGIISKDETRVEILLQKLSDLSERISSERAIYYIEKINTYILKNTSNHVREPIIHHEDSFLSFDYYLGRGPIHIENKNNNHKFSERYPELTQKLYFNNHPRILNAGDTLLYMDMEKKEIGEGISLEEIITKLYFAPCKIETKEYGNGTLYIFSEEQETCIERGNCTSVCTEYGSIYGVVESVSQRAMFWGRTSHLVAKNIEKIMETVVLK